MRIDRIGRRALGCFALLVVVLLGGWGRGLVTPSLASPDPGPIMVGMALARTGYLAGFDRPVEAGAQLAVREMNSQGGVLHRQLKLIVVDMQSDPQHGLQAVDQLISSYHVVALANGFSSAATAASAPVAARNQVPMVVASVLPQDHHWVFSTIPPANYETGVRVDYLKSKHITKVGIIKDNTPYAAQLYAAAQAQLAAAHIDIADVEQQSTDATDLRPQLAKILSAHPGAIIKFGSGPTAVVAAKGLGQLGASIPLLLSIDSLQIFQQATQAYPQVLFAAAPPQVYSELPAAQKSPSLVRFVALWQRAEPGQDPTYGGRGWDAIYLIARAIIHAGGTEGDKLRDSLETMGPYQGTSGTYQFSATDHYGLHENPMVLARMRADGHIQIVYIPGKR